MAMALPKSSNKFAKILSAFIKREGLNPHKAADRLQVRHQQLYTWLNGQCLPPARQTRLIAELIGDPELVSVCERVRTRRRLARARTAGAA